MTHRIFLVEDHPVMREAYGHLLAVEPGLELCGESETAEEFLDVIDDSPCTLVVTDLSLPGMDGITLVGEIRARRPTLPVIVISAHEESGYQERAKRAGAQAYLVKGDMAEQLAPTIHRVMDQAAH